MNGDLQLLSGQLVLKTEIGSGVNIEGLGIVLKKIEDAFRKKRLNQLLMLWRKLPPPWGDIVLISVTVRGDIYVLKFTHTKFWNTCKIVTRRVATFFLVRKKHFIGIWLLNLLWSSIFFKTIPNPSILTPEIGYPCLKRPCHNKLCFEKCSQDGDSLFRLPDFGLNSGCKDALQTSKCVWHYSLTPTWANGIKKGAFKSCILLESGQYDHLIGQNFVYNIWTFPPPVRHKGFGDEKPHERHTTTLLHGRLYVA